jgi:hypothetical protein
MQFFAKLRKFLKFGTNSFATNGFSFNAKPEDPNHRSLATNVLFLGTGPPVQNSTSEVSLHELQD